MNAVDVIADAAQRTGYRDEAIVRDYAFADVLDPSDATRTVSLAAFTQTPPSYRSAALAVVSVGHWDTLDWVKAHRALGAPLLFVIEDDQVCLWQVRGNDPPRVMRRLPLVDVPALFKEHQEKWHPDAIHRAKSMGAVNQAYQLDFVDVGLMPAVEGEIHFKLHHLLVDTLKAASQAPCDRPDPRLLFRVVFRLLAAKVLQDRGHPCAQTWDVTDLASVLRAIESYYSLPPVLGVDRRTVSLAFSEAWEHLRRGINFSNISSDDLAFVYENTLVTPEARKNFSTHKTPRQLAEYAVARLGLHREEQNSLSIYEPFAGAGTFLVSALRHMRDLLPVDWKDQKRHAFLVDRLTGDEIDPFACEVATLSLILADYPNQNGWRICESDLFKDGVLQSHMEKGNVVLCNPPFENFSDEERTRYAIAKEFYSKPMAVLNAALDAHPRALAFVLPRPFIMDRKFAAQRRRIEELYGDVELVELPDGFFDVSTIESALLLAREPRPPAPAVITVRSTEVANHDAAAFLKIGRTTTERSLVRAVEDPPSGNLWITPLTALWSYLNTAPRLSSYFDIHRGIEWKSAQGAAWSNQPQAGYRQGAHTARLLKQFMLPISKFLDCREERLRGNAISLRWDDPKLVVNAARLRRNSWRIAAALDKGGLVCSQQFFGLWPHAPLTDAQFLTFAAILNGPIANAFLATHSPANRIRISVISQIPIPSTLPFHVGQSVADYVQQLLGLGTAGSTDEQMEKILTLIDAAVLGAYDLPPRLECQLLGYFRGTDRPVAHPWRHWDEHNPAPGLTLAERVSRRFHPHGSWVPKVFQPLPPDEAELFWTYGA